MLPQARPHVFDHSKHAKNYVFLDTQDICICFYFAVENYVYFLMTITDSRKNERIFCILENKLIEGEKNYVSFSRSKSS